MAATTIPTRDLKGNFPATLDNIDVICDKIKELLVSTGHEEQLFSAALLAREALANAVKHGSGNDPDKIVSFSMTIGDTSLSLEVEDEGPGFDWKETTAEETKHDDESGRGLPIFSYYAEDVEFNEKGNKVFLKMDISCTGGDHE